MTADRQKQLEQMHVENVFTEQQKKDQEIAHTIDKNVHEAHQRALEKEAYLKKKREEVNYNYQKGVSNTINNLGSKQP